MLSGQRNKKHDTKNKNSSRYVSFVWYDEIVILERFNETSLLDKK